MAPATEGIARFTAKGRERLRNHQGLGNRLINPGEEVGLMQGDIECRERLGGLLRYYYRDAA